MVVEITMIDMKRTKRSGPRTKSRGTPVHIIMQGDDFIRGCAICQKGANPRDSPAR